MKTLTAAILVMLCLPFAARADDEIIPKVEKSNMQNIKSQFGKSIADKAKSKDADRDKKDTDDTAQAGEPSKPPKDNFGSKASAEAKKLRESGDIKKGGMGAWARTNNPGASKRDDDESKGLSKSAAAHEKAPGGRPANAGGGKPDGVGGGKPDVGSHPGKGN